MEHASVKVVVWNRKNKLLNEQTLSIFRQKQIDSLVQHIKKQALAGEGFSEGANRKRRIPPKPTDIEELAAPQSIERMQNELLYLRQEVEFLKKIIIADNSRKKK